VEQVITLIGKKNMTQTALSISLLLFLTGCGQNIKLRVAQNEADSLNQHIVTGLSELENNNIKSAKFHFNNAKTLDNKNSSVYSSLALVSKNYEDLLDKSEDLVENNIEKYRYKLAQIRVSKDKETLEDLYKDTHKIKIKYLPYYHDKGSLDYFIGKQFFIMKNYKKASFYFEHLFQNFQDSKFKHKAKKLWESSNKKLRAMNLSKFSVTTSKIATYEKIKRADVAVILVDELHLDKLLNGFFKSRKKEFDTPIPKDILNHPNITELKIISKYSLRGLNPIVENDDIKFKPNRAISRGDFALILEDIVSKLKNDTKMKQRYFGINSPFVDVKSTQYNFNAILNAVTMGFLKPNKYQEFRPNDTLTGVELIEAIAKIKEEIEL
jgi:hypothetical protein